MKLVSVLLLTVATSGWMAAVRADVDCQPHWEDVCPGCILGSIIGSSVVTSRVERDCSGSYSDKRVAVCNFLSCICKPCAGCGPCQRATRDLGWGSALSLAANNTVNSTDPCANFNDFAAMTVPHLMERLNTAFCADTNSTVGFKFLGHVLNLIDVNKDGVITCAEFNADRLYSLDVIKKKPACPLKAGLKLKSAHSQA